MLNLKNIHSMFSLKMMHKALHCFEKRYLCTSSSDFWNTHYSPNLDVEYLCDSCNEVEITDNIHKRKGVGDIKLVYELISKINDANLTDVNRNSLKNQLLEELLKIPNKTHPSVKNYKEPKLVKLVGEKNDFSSNLREFYDISKGLNLIRTDQLGNVSGNRSYFLLGDMAILEQALVQYTVDKLLNYRFKLTSVPDILPRDIIENCGMNTKGERNQVYSLDSKLHGDDLCLSGTSEMALAGLFAGKTYDECDLPLKFCAVSRCYRAEASSTSEEKGIYRVHEFTKVEMFAISSMEQSDNVLEEIRKIEEEFFSELGLCYRVLDMPPYELGAPAYRKYDIEAWLPGRNIFGEISSCSNCTDYQSRRLNIQYRGNCVLNYAHTLNGTACAIPRMLIALTETFQNNEGLIVIPEKLQKYFHKMLISKQKAIPPLRLIKNKK